MTFLDQALYITDWLPFFLFSNWMYAWILFDIERSNYGMVQQGK